MSFQSTQIYPQNFVSTPTGFTNATGTTATQILGAQTNGIQIRSILCANSDTSAHDVELSVKNAGSTYQIAQISIPAGAGFSNSVPPVDLLQALIAGSMAIPLNRDSAGNPFIRLDSATSLYLGLAVALGTGKALDVLVWGDTF
jgi:hypothetical protein